MAQAKPKASSQDETKPAVESEIKAKPAAKKEALTVKNVKLKGSVQVMPGEDALNGVNLLPAELADELIEQGLATLVE